jgi:hypothetical protein
MAAVVLLTLFFYGVAVALFLIARLLITGKEAASRRDRQAPCWHVG